jgi:hypothetical protein
VFSVGSVASHLSALPGVTEEKCRASSWPCAPTVSAAVIAAPTGNSVTTSRTRGMSVWIGSAGTYEIDTSSTWKAPVVFAVST